MPTMFLARCTSRGRLGGFLALSAILASCISGCFVLPPTPTIESVEPNSGPTTGGTQITIIGAWFAEPVAVTLNDVATTNVQIIHAQALTAVTPPGDAGPATVAMRFSDGRTVTVADAFTYVPPADQQSAADIPLTITALTPISGPTAGGTSLTLEGTGFVPDAVLLIDEQPAHNFEYITERLITATAPPGNAGTAEVVLITGDGRTTSFPPGFTYLAPDDPVFPQPTVVSISPTAGPFTGGTEVTVRGTAFEPGSVVLFGDVLAEGTEFVSFAILRSISPPATPGLVDVTVELPDGRRVTGGQQFEYLPPAAPTVASVSPDSGPEAGGTVVTITGASFFDVADVTFGGASATTFSVLSATTVEAESPPGVGTVTLEVHTPHGIAEALFTYIAPAAPTIASVTPDSGPEAGGTVVSIRGTNFYDVADVTFGGISAVAFTVLSETVVEAETPPGVGTVTLDVQTPHGIAEALFTYLPPDAPTISSVSPASGPDAGGTIVTIRGTDFVGTTDVTFDGNSATAFSVLGDSRLQAVTPAGAGTAVSVEVVHPNGNAGSFFDYIPPATPTIGTVSPDSGPEAGGTVVTVMGTAFTGATDVRFDGNSATAFTVLSDTMLQAVTPVSVPGAGTVSLEVDTPNGIADAFFTYIPPDEPTIGAVAPDSGPAAGGTVVTITGTAFSGTTDVKFDISSASAFTVLSDTLIQAVSPLGTAGTVVLTVETPNGNAQALFTYVAPDTPTIGSVDPASGPEAGGTVVTVTGTAFTGATGVTFDGNAATAFTVLSETLLQAVSPAGTGTVILEIVTPNGNAQALYTYVPADPPASPTIGSVDPASGPEAGGTVVTVTGTAFTGATGVTFDGNAATAFTVLSDTLLQAVSPAGTSTVILEIVTPNGNAQALFTYIVPDTPTIGSVDPASGPDGGGTIVTIIGTAFTGTTGVTFDGNAAAAFTVLSDTLLQAVSPAGTSTVILEIVTPNGNAQALFTYILPDTPTIGSVDPASGPDGGGTIVTIMGTAFTGTTGVTFDGNAAAAFTVLSDTLLQAVSPAGTGTVILEVVTPNGNAQALYTYIADTPPASPTIGSVNPASGPETGGTLVTVSGTSFTGTTGVTFDGNAATAFAVLSDTLLQAVSPAGTGTVILEVVTPNGNAQALFTYVPPNTPTIGSVDPASGAEAGGTVVTLTGTAFTGATGVMFGANPATNFTVLSDTVIQAESPAGTGTVILEVQTPNGNASALFTYVPPDTPTISRVWPIKGPAAGGTVVTITGTAFTGTTDVTFAGNSATVFTVLSDTRIQAESPAGAAGTVILEVQTPNGNAQALWTYE